MKRCEYISTPERWSRYIVRRAPGVSPYLKFTGTVEAPPVNTIPCAPWERGVATRVSVQGSWLYDEVDDVFYYQQPATHEVNNDEYYTTYEVHG